MVPNTYSNPSYSRGSGREIMSLRQTQANLVRSYLKNKITLKRLGVAQVAERLPRKQRACVQFPVSQVNK